MDLGDRTEDTTLDFMFSTRNVSAAPAALASGAISIYKANGTTQSTAGITLTASFDGVTGLNHVRIVTTDAFYAAANDYIVVITTGTVNSVSVVGTTIATFSIENRFMRGTNNAATAAALVVVGLNVLALQGTGFVTGTDSNEAIKNTIDALNDFNPSTDTVANVTTVATTTTNTDMVGTDNALLAASAPTNFSSQVISGAGAVDSLVQGFINTTLTESSVARINNNFEFFYDNADAQTTQVVDDVGGGGGGGTDWTASERNEIRGRLGVTGTTAAGGNTPTLSTQASVDTVDTNVDAILVDTGTTIPNQISALNDFDPATEAVANVTLVATTTTNTDMRGTDSAATASALATVDSNVDAILVDTGTTLPAQITALNDISTAQVNAEVLDVMTVDTFAEPGSVPAATASLKDKIGWVAALARNKLTQTATTQSLRNDAQTGDIATATVSDDGTIFTRDEFS